VAIVVDDGIATGATTRAALQAVRSRRPKRLVLAVPVAPTSTLGEFELENEADEVVCLEDYEPFGAIGFYYRNFRQVGDQEVTDILSRFAADRSLQIFPSIRLTPPSDGQAQADRPEQPGDPNGGRPRSER
jgi:predicted phosphoribosyltransferase